MFGMMEAMLSFLRRQVGLRDDAASSTGSAHAKLAHINADIDTIAAKNILANNSVIRSRDYMLLVWRGILPPII